MHRHFAPKSISYNIQSRVTEVINWAEGGKNDDVQLPLHPPEPELVQVLRAESSKVFVPEAEVKLKRDRHFRVIVVSTPLPARVSKHDRQMVCEVGIYIPTSARDRLVPEIG